VVKDRGQPPKRWKWEIYRAGRSSAVELSETFFTTMTAAHKAGKEALARLFKKFEDPDFGYTGSRACHRNWKVEVRGCAWLRGARSLGQPVQRQPTPPAHGLCSTVVASVQRGAPTRPRPAHSRSGPLRHRGSRFAFCPSRDPRRQIVALQKYNLYVHRRRHEGFQIPRSFLCDGPRGAMRCSIPRILRWRVSRGHERRSRKFNNLHTWADRNSAANSCGQSLRHDWRSELPRTIKKKAPTSGLGGLGGRGRGLCSLGKSRQSR
jgi:hypothetical protein